MSEYIVQPLVHMSSIRVQHPEGFADIESFDAHGTNIVGIVEEIDRYSGPAVVIRLAPDVVERGALSSHVSNVCNTLTANSTEADGRPNNVILLEAPIPGPNKHESHPETIRRHRFGVKSGVSSLIHSVLG